MTHAYNELYLNDAKETLSEFFDYGITDNKMDADMLAQIFSHSVYGSMFEKGNPSVAIGIYAAVLHALNNMDKDLLLVAKDDELGRKLQDLELTTRRRAPRNGGE